MSSPTDRKETSGLPEAFLGNIFEKKRSQQTDLFRYAENDLFPHAGTVVSRGKKPLCNTLKIKAYKSAKIVL